MDWNWLMGRVGWNLFLAAIPVGLGYGLAWGLGGRGKTRRLPLWVCLPLGVAWLAFLPNTCYLLTEWRHLLLDRRWADVLDVSDADNSAMFSIAKWALFFVAYSGSGVLLFVLSIRPVEQWLKAAGRSILVVAPLLFFVTSLGVYLGLVQRLNSWDLWNRPRYVWLITTHALVEPKLLGSIIVFALILWFLYEAVDLWVDGVLDRLKRWGAAGVSAPVRTT